MRNPTPTTSKRRFVRLSNGACARADFIAAVSTHEETLRIFLKAETGETLCAVQHEDPEAFKAELETIGTQIG